MRVRARFNTIIMKHNIVPYDEFTSLVDYPEGEYLCNIIERSHSGGVLPEQSIKPVYDDDGTDFVDPSIDITSDPMYLAELAQRNFSRRAADAITRAANSAVPAVSTDDTAASPVNSADNSAVSTSSSSSD